VQRTPVANTRTLILLPLDVGEHDSIGGRHRWKSRTAGGPMSVSRPCSAARVAGSDAPLIGERAPTRGRIQSKVAMGALV